MKRDFTKTVVSLAAISMVMMLTVGFTGIDLIEKARGRLISHLRDVKSDSDKTIRSVYAYSSKLKNFMEEDDLRDRNLRLLERYLKDIRDKYDRLNRSINTGKSDANALFDILRPRAEENQDENLKGKLLMGIETHKICFQKQMAKTGPLMRRLDRWIQQFDDIVGYCQITREADDDSIADISRTIENEKELSSEIKECIDTGLEIIEKISCRNFSCDSVRGCDS